jgi:hypothetical protein
MSVNLGSVLIAEIGSITTRVMLVDTVEGETRLIGHAEVPSTAEPPYDDVFIGVLEAALQISAQTGRELLHEGRLFKPQNSERDGVNHVIVTTSAAGSLDTLVVGISHDVSVESARRAARSTYTTILQTVALDDAVLQPELLRTTSWVERQVQTMLEKRPAAIVLAGGIEGGAHDVLCRLAHIVAFVVRHMASESAEGEGGFGGTVIYAGNSAAQDCVSAALQDHSRLMMVENVRPSLEEERLDGARRELMRLYDEHVLPNLPGISTLKRLCSTPVSTVCAAEGLMTRFLAERPPHQRHILTVDVGATSSSAFFATPQRFYPVVLGLCGTGFGLMSLVRARGLHNIARWLPFSISDKDLLHWLLNKQLRPQMIPTTRQDVLIEHAIVREALSMLKEEVSEQCPDLHYDMVMIGGGVLAHAPHPAMAALTVLDALQPTGENIDRMLELRLDMLGLLPACGALAALDADSAVTLFERDVLQNVLLSTCVVALGDGKPTDVAVEAELTLEHGETRRIQVRHGQIGRLPLSLGAEGRLRLQPAGGVRIGDNEPGQSIEPTSDLDRVRGSLLGVVIDARGRPLQLPADNAKRMSQLGEWLAALGVDEGATPDVSAAPAPVAPPLAAPRRAAPAASPAPAGLNGGAGQEPAFAADLPPEQPSFPMPEPSELVEAEAAQPRKGRRVSLADLAQQGEDEAPSPQAKPEAEQLQDDLASLRQTVEQPEKRGLFGRKKRK